MSILPLKDTQRRRRQLDREQVVRAALTLLDEVGLDELTMRRLAEKLNVKAASLYRHVASKEELMALLADQISGEIPITPATGSWRERMTAMARNVRRGLLAHRDAARVLALTAPFGPRRLRHIESVLQTLRAAGLRDRDAARAAYHCNNFITEFVADEARMAAFAAAPGPGRKKIFEEARRHFKSLPRDQFPAIVALADDLAEDNQDALFEFGIEMMMRGIDAMAKKR